MQYQCRSELELSAWKSAIWNFAWILCQFRGSLAMDLYAVGLAAVDLSLLETLTVSLVLLVVIHLEYIMPQHSKTFI